jgi:hypothetical protein
MAARRTTESSVREASPEETGPAASLPQSHGQYSCRSGEQGGGREEGIWILYRVRYITAQGCPVEPSRFAISIPLLLNGSRYVYRIERFTRY